MYATIVFARATHRIRLVALLTGLLNGLPASGQSPPPGGAWSDSAVASLAPVHLPGVGRGGRHERGGAALTALFGDSADHTRHSIVNLAVASGTTMAVLWALPEHITLWRRQRPPLTTLRMSYTMAPRWDTDPWVFNYVGHPLAGMHVYLLERNWGTSQWRSFLFATAASIGWEYGFEAFMERPSIQDLLITSPSGSLLGEASHRLTQRLRRNGFSTVERIALIVVNPLYPLQHGFR